MLCYAFDWKINWKLKKVIGFRDLNWKSPIDRNMSFQVRAKKGAVVSESSAYSTST
jgi:hypothetical protein